MLDKLEDETAEYRAYRGFPGMIADASFAFVVGTFYAAAFVASCLFWIWIGRAIGAFLGIGSHNG